MLKPLIIFNIVLAILNLVLLWNRESGAEKDIVERVPGREGSEPRSSTSPSAPRNRLTGRGIASQLGGGPSEGMKKTSPPVVTEQGQSWHLPENHLVIALYESIGSKHPPRLQEQMASDLELTVEQHAAMDEALSNAANALMENERARREIRTDDEGKRYVYVAEFKDEAERIFAELEVALANASDPDSAAIMMIGVKNSVYFRKRGEEAKLTRGVGHGGKPAIKDWRGDWVNRSGGFGMVHGVMHIPFDGSCDHLIDLEELGWLEENVDGSE